MNRGSDDYYAERPDEPDVTPEDVLAPDELASYRHRPRRDLGRAHKYPYPWLSAYNEEGPVA